MTDLLDSSRSSGAVAKGSRGGARPGAGRPVGSFNRVNTDLRAYLIALSKGKDAIVEHWRLAALPLMGESDAKAEAAIERIMRRAGCTRKEAFVLWQDSARLVFPKVYPDLGKLEILPPGTIGGLPLDFAPVGENGRRRIATLDDGATTDADFEELAPEGEE